MIVQIDPRERKDLDTLALRSMAPIDERRYGGTLLLFYERLAEGADHEDKDDDQSGKSLRVSG